MSKRINMNPMRRIVSTRGYRLNTRYETLECGHEVFSELRDAQPEPKRRRCPKCGVNK